MDELDGAGAHLEPLIVDTEFSNLIRRQKREFSVRNIVSTPLFSSGASGDTGRERLLYNMGSSRTAVRSRILRPLPLTNPIISVMHGCFF